MSQHLLRCASTLILLGVLVWVNQQLHPVEALTIAAAGDVNASHDRLTIRVTCVTSPMDVCALADLRFTEWIMTTKNNEDDETPHNTADSRSIVHNHPTPSAQAFRMATADITAERGAQGAVAFLAQTTDGTTVGAAELSPIELQQCILVQDDTNPPSTLNGFVSTQQEDYYYYYVTDVVTARTHQRMGVGKALMKAIEQEASKKQKGTTTTGISWLLLHVEEDNGAALHFYKRGGYLEPPTQLLQTLDTDRLAQNAGTIGQILLSKPIPIIDFPKEQRTNHNKSGGGFGGKNLARRKQPKKSSRR